jgi:hypothetical protein
MESPEPTQAAPIVSAEQFLKGLAECGLLSDEEIQGALAHVSAAQRQDARALAQVLMMQEKLTRFQASMLLQGKVKGLGSGCFVSL